MTVSLIIDGENIPVNHIRFSDGSSNVKIDFPSDMKTVERYFSITVDTTTPCDNYLWEILLTVDAIETELSIRESQPPKKIIVLPYLPHARADRVFQRGNAFPLDIFLRQFGYNGYEIMLTDPHSDVYKDYEGAINFMVKDQVWCFVDTMRRMEESVKIKNGDYLVSPDKGALHKVYKLQNELKSYNIHVGIVEANKVRELETGRIISTTVKVHSDSNLINFDVMDYDNRTFWIVDDICDGGGTFIPLADFLRKNGVENINLYVTHGIFAKGLDVFRGYIDNIYCYHIIGNYVNQTNIEQYNKGI